MILWLASYPRSGNTLLRLIFNHAFGIQTFSIYDDKYDLGRDPAVAEMVGHRTHGLTPQAFTAQAAAAPETLYVKTHEKSQDTHPAIYVVRDPRASIVSYWRYEHDVAERQTPIESVIAGDVHFGGWGDHVASWCLSNRPNTFVVRYEELAQADAAILERIGDFIGVKPRSGFNLSFDELHRLFPKFFRQGSNTASFAQLTAAQNRLIDIRHGAVMRAMGYSFD